MPPHTRHLPLFVGLAGLILYAGTMGGEMTLNTLPLASKLGGWDEGPLVGQPLLWLLTLPLQALPAGWLPPLLKLLAAVLAAGILGLLTRTVQLLPWERPWNHASRLACLLPGLTAAAVCGLEFNFWQEATSTCGDLLDLLLLAGAVWLLLEYHRRREARWLNAATVVWGLGMAENWLMALALPLFVATVVWLHRTGFFRWPFVLRLAVLGLAGCSVYAVLPLANGLRPQGLWTLWQAWDASLHQTKSAILLPFKLWTANRFVALTVAICFLLPLLSLTVRMRDKGMRHESFAGRVQLWLYRCLRLGLLLAGCWLAFDPNAGARQALRQIGMRLPLLTLDYLTALGTAFLVGNFLLISGSVLRDLRRPSRTKIQRWRLPVSIATAFLMVVAAGLAARNAPAIWRANHYPAERFGDLALKSLPRGGGVVLSDDPAKLIVFEAALARGRGAADWLAVDTRALPAVPYRARLEQRRPAGWLTDRTRHELTPVEMLALLEQVARTNRLFYLHPSFGRFFEGFYLEPAGMIYEMKPRGKDPLDLPPMNAASREANEQFWTRWWELELAELVSPPTRPAWWERAGARLGLSPAPRDQDRLLRDWYSIPLGTWGVALQRQGRLREAQTRLEQALLLNPNNLPAWFSLAWNKNAQAGNHTGLSDFRRLASQPGNPNLMPGVLNSSGPFDEPTVGYFIGSVYYDHGMLVQAAEAMERVRAQVPGAPAPEMKLVAIYNLLRMPERSRPLVNHLRETFRNAPANSLLDTELAMQESYSWVLQTNLANASETLQALVRQYPDDPHIASRVVGALLAFRDVTNAWQLAEERLAKSPDDVAALNDEAMVLLQSGQAAAALPLLNHILTLTNMPAAHRNRAFARIATRDFAQGKTELIELENTGAADGLVDYGLALVAWHGHETNSARHYLQLSLSNSPAGGPLWQQAKTGLRMLELAK